MSDPGVALTMLGILVFVIMIGFPVAFTLMALQGLAETLRCVLCLRTGEWPARLHDVEELENQILAKAARKRAAEGAAA